MVLVGGTSEPGGLHLHTADLALAMTAAGAKVTIACSSTDFFSALVRGSPVRVVTVPATGRGARAALQLRAWLAALAATDIVLCHGTLGQSDPLTLAAARSACQALYTVEHRPAEGHISASLKRRVKGWLMSRLVRKALAVSGEIQEQAIGIYGLSRELIGVFPNWVDPSFHFVTPERRLAAKGALRLPGGITIGFHGRLAPEKRVDCLIAAFARLPKECRAETCLAIVGDGWKRRELEALAVGLGVASEVRFLGWRPDPVEAVAAFDVSVLPSLIEGFPLALMEAMAAGALCLAHPMPSTGELLGQDRGMLRDIASPQQLSDALAASIALPPAARAALGQRASSWVLSRYSRAERLGQLLAAIDLHPGDGPVREIGPRQLEFPRP